MNPGKKKLYQTRIHAHTHTNRHTHTQTQTHTNTHTHYTSQQKGVELCKHEERHAFNILQEETLYKDRCIHIEINLHNKSLVQENQE